VADSVGLRISVRSSSAEWRQHTAGWHRRIGYRLKVTFRFMTMTNTSNLPVVQTVSAVIPEWRRRTARALVIGPNETRTVRINPMRQPASSPTDCWQCASEKMFVGSPAACRLVHFLPQVRASRVGQTSVGPDVNGLESFDFVSRDPHGERSLDRIHGND
jgi:hypothetical protein